MRFTALTMLISAQSGTVTNLNFVPMVIWHLYHWGNVVPVKQCVPRTRLKIKMTSQWRNFSMTSECLKIMNQRKCQTPTFRLNLRTALQ